MSNPILNQCWPLQMPLTAKAVLISMADQADDDGHCWPSIQHLSERTCASKRAVIDAIKWLERSCVIVADRSNGRHTRYRVTPTLFAPSQDRSPRTQARQTTSADAAPVPVQMPHQCSSRTGADAAPTSADAAPVPVQMPHQPVQMPHTNPQEPSIEPSITPTTRAKRSSAELPDGFAEFWDRFPKKTAKAVAASSWVRKRLHVDQALREVVMAALAQHRMLPQWAKDGGRFVPNPATWLNQERWTDEFGPVAASQQGSGTSHPHGSLAAQAASVPHGWWEQAGFECVEEAANFGCYWTNFAQFRDRRRIAEEVPT